MPNTVNIKDAAGGTVTVETVGTPITGQTLESGGASTSGWLSSLRKALTDRLPAALVSGRLDVNIGSGSVTAVPGAIGLTYVDRSGSIAAAPTAQVLMAANSTRKTLLIQNPTTATETLWIRFTGTAAIDGNTSWPLEPGDTWFESGSGVSTQAVSVCAATTGHVWRAMES